MKFVTDSVNRCARLGTLTELEKFPNVIFETPLVSIYTRKGAVPHLTKDVFKMVTNEQQMLSVTLPTTLTMVDAVKQFNSFTEFVSMKEYPMVLTIQDPSQKIPNGYQKHITTPVWSKHGHHPVSPDIYMDLAEAFKPDMYVVLCDGATHAKTSPVKIGQIIERNKRQFLKCLERHKKSEALKNTWVLGAVEGGYDLKAREESVKFLRDKDLNGYVIDGLHVNGPEVTDIPFKQIQEVLHHTLSLLPLEKIKLSMGCWNPLVTLQLIDSGVDIFDSSYPYVMTEASRAIVFTCNTHDHSNNDKPELTISMAEKCYAEDFSPICDTCQCLTCKNHTRAYLNHLHNTKELLGSVLLMIHNTHVYIEFFKTIREHLKKGTFQKYKDEILTKYL